MTTVAQIITDAYQLPNIVAMSAIPTAGEQAKGLRYLNRIFNSTLGNELGGSLSSYNLGQTGLISSEHTSLFTLQHPYLLPANSKIDARLDTSLTVYLNPNPMDGERVAVQDVGETFASNVLTISANGKKIENTSSVVLTTSGTNSAWFYRADLSNWVKITNLELSDEFPLPPEFEEYFITMLSLRLSASEDVGMTSSIQYIMKEVAKRMRARYKQTAAVDLPSGLVYLTARTHHPLSEFNYG